MKYSPDYGFLKYAQSIVVFTLFTFKVNNSLSNKRSQTIIT